VGQTSERMSKVDTAWLRMDTEANLMMIVGVWSIRPGITLSRLRERVAERLLQYPRFRQKVVEDGLMGSQWVLDKDFDIARHVVAEVPLPLRGQSNDEVLRERVAELCSQPLDPAHPLWQMQLIEDMGDGTSALISRIHHCIADGIALIAVMLSITDGGKAPPQRTKAAAEEPQEADWKSDIKILESEHRGLRTVVAALVSVSPRTLHLIRGAAAHDIYHAGQIRLLRRLQEDELAIQKASRKSN